MLTKIHHVGIVVSDLQRSLEFYQKVLGFQPGPRHRLPHAELAFLSLGGQDIELIQYLDGRLGNASTYGRISHLAIVTTDLKQDIERLQDAGVEMLSQSSMAGVGGSQIFFIKGPDEEIIELFQPGTPKG
ncbi:MAG: VOC family protein [Bacillota bacterium]